MLFADLRGWTNFVDAVEPEELMQVLEEFHGRSAGWCNGSTRRSGSSRETASSSSSTIPTRSPTRRCGAVRLACALREEMEKLTPSWRKRGYDLGLGVGVALGHATCGEVGFEGRSDYAAIGAVTNLAARLADEASAGQVLISQRLHADIEEEVEVEPVGELTLKGFDSRSRRSTFCPRGGEAPPGDRSRLNVSSRAVSRDYAGSPGGGRAPAATSPRSGPPCVARRST